MTSQLRHPCETWAQTVLKLLWQQLSPCIISPVSRDEACIYSNQKSVINYSNMCLAVLDCNVSHPNGCVCSSLSLDFESVVFLIGQQDTITSCTLQFINKDLMFYLITWLTLTPVWPQRAIFESINSTDMSLMATAIILSLAAALETKGEMLSFWF